MVLSYAGFLNYFHSFWYEQHSFIGVGIFPTKDQSQRNCIDSAYMIYQDLVASKLWSLKQDNN